METNAAVNPSETKWNPYGSEKSASFIELCESHNVDHTKIPEIKTFEEACTALEIDHTQLPDVKNVPAEFAKQIVSHYKLMIIARALNNKWEPDWADEDQYKYFPYFGIEKDSSQPSGVGFSLTDCGSWDTVAYVGSRLCFETRDLALYAARQFSKEYQDYMLIA